jgi:hypothetical protein
MRRGTGRPAYDIMHQEYPLKVFPRCKPFSRGEDVARFDGVIPVIEDDPDAWRSLQLTLKKAGHKVIGTVRFDGS